MTELNSKQRASLRARAHALNPVVQVGHAGLSEAVLRQINEALTAHELIKVKLSKDSPISLDEAAAAISSSARCAVVQKIGRVLALFRRNPKQPKIGLAVKAQHNPNENDPAAVSAKSGRQLNRNRKARRRGARGAKPGRSPRIARAASTARRKA